MMEILPKAPAHARRELRVEEMTDHGFQLAWLRNPDLIPESATVMEDMPEALGGSNNPYFSLGWWMIYEVGEWSATAHTKLDYEAVFAKHGLADKDQSVVRNSIRDDVIPSYGAGILATSEVYGVIPLVAAREGADRPAQWSEIASQARLFGREIAHHGSNVMALIREYLIGGYYKGNDVTRFNPAKIKLDADTGITTVTPIDEIIETAKAILEDEDAAEEDHSGVCVALQSVPTGCPKEPMFDLIWSAYGVPTAKYIYAKEQPGSIINIPGAERPDTNLQVTLRHQILKRMSEED